MSFWLLKKIKHWRSSRTVNQPVSLGSRDQAKIFQSWTGMMSPFLLKNFPLIAGLFLLVVGGVAASWLVQVNQDLRQQARNADYELLPSGYVKPTVEVTPAGGYPSCSWGSYGSHACSGIETCVKCGYDASTKKPVSKKVDRSVCNGLPCGADQITVKQCSSGTSLYNSGSYACKSSTECVVCKNGAWTSTSRGNCIGKSCGIIVTPIAALSPTVATGLVCYMEVGSCPPGTVQSSGCSGCSDNYGTCCKKVPATPTPSPAAPTMVPTGSASCHYGYTSCPSGYEKVSGCSGCSGSSNSCCRKIASVVPTSLPISSVVPTGPSAMPTAVGSSCYYGYSSCPAGYESSSNCGGCGGGKCCKKMAPTVAPVAPTKAANYSSCSGDNQCSSGYCERGSCVPESVGIAMRDLGKEGESCGGQKGCASGLSCGGDNRCRSVGGSCNVSYTESCSKVIGKITAHGTRTCAYTKYNSSGNCQDGVKCGECVIGESAQPTSIPTAVPVKIPSPTSATSCSVGQTKCDGRTVKQCISSGVWVTKKTCGDSEVCNSGSCVSTLPAPTPATSIYCSVGQTKCDGNNVKQCIGAGVWVTKKTCSGVYHCEDGSCQGTLDSKWKTVAGLTAEQVVGAYISGQYSEEDLQANCLEIRGDRDVCDTTNEALATLSPGYDSSAVKYLHENNTLLAAYLNGEDVVDEIQDTCKERYGLFASQCGSYSQLEIGEAELIQTTLGYKLKDLDVAARNTNITNHVLTNDGEWSEEKIEAITENFDANDRQVFNEMRFLAGGGKGTVGEPLSNLAGALFGASTVNYVDVQTDFGNQYSQMDKIGASVELGSKVGTVVGAAIAAPVSVGFVAAQGGLAALSLASGLATANTALGITLGVASTGGSAANVFYTCDTGGSECTQAIVSTALGAGGVALRTVTGSGIVANLTGQTTGLYSDISNIGNLQTVTRAGGLLLSTAGSGLSISTSKELCETYGQGSSQCQSAIANQTANVLGTVSSAVGVAGAFFDPGTSADLNLIFDLGADFSDVTANNAQIRDACLRSGGDSWTCANAALQFLVDLTNAGYEIQRDIGDYRNLTTNPGSGNLPGAGGQRLPTVDSEIAAAMATAAQRASFFDPSEPIDSSTFRIIDLDGTKPGATVERDANLSKDAPEDDNALFTALEDWGGELRVSDQDRLANLETRLAEGAEDDNSLAKAGVNATEEKEPETGQDTTEDEGAEALHLQDPEQSKEAAQPADGELVRNREAEPDSVDVEKVESDNPVVKNDAEPESVVAEEAAPVISWWEKLFDFPGAIRRQVLGPTEEEAQSVAPIKGEPDETNPARIGQDDSVAEELLEEPPAKVAKVEPAKQPAEEENPNLVVEHKADPDSDEKVAGPEPGAGTVKTSQPGDEDDSNFVQKWWEQKVKPILLSNVDVYDSELAQWFRNKFGIDSTKVAEQPSDAEIAKVGPDSAEAEPAVAAKLPAEPGEEPIRLAAGKLDLTQWTSDDLGRLVTVDAPQFSESDVIAGAKIMLGDQRTPVSHSQVLNLPLDSGKLLEAAGISNNGRQEFASRGIYYLLTKSTSTEGVVSAKYYLSFRDEESVKDFFIELAKKIPNLEKNGLDLYYKTSEEEMIVYLSGDPFKLPNQTYQQARNDLDSLFRDLASGDRGVYYDRGGGEDPQAVVIDDSGISNGSTAPNEGPSVDAVIERFIVPRLLTSLGEIGAIGNSFHPQVYKAQLNGIIDGPDSPARRLLLSEYSDLAKLFFRDPSNPTLKTTLPIAVDTSNPQKLAEAIEYAESLRKNGYQVAIVDLKDFVFDDMTREYYLSGAVARNGIVTKIDLDSARLAVENSEVPVAAEKPNWWQRLASLGESVFGNKSSDGEKVAPEEVAQEVEKEDQARQLSQNLVSDTPNVTNRVTIGRNSGDVWVQEDEGVSRMHASLEIDSRGQLTIVDLNSTNGVWVNGLRVPWANLNTGDIVRLGSTDFKVIEDPTSKIPTLVQNSGRHVGKKIAIAKDPVAEINPLVEKVDIQFEVVDAKYVNSTGQQRVGIKTTDSSLLTFLAGLQKTVHYTEEAEILAARIRDYVSEVFSGYNQDAFEEAIKQVTQTEQGLYRGKTVDLGEFINAKAAVCREQAILLHLALAQEGIESRVVVGNLPSQGRDARHAWVEYYNPRIEDYSVVDSVWNRGVIPSDHASKAYEVYGGVAEKKSLVFVEPKNPINPQRGQVKVNPIGVIDRLVSGIRNFSFFNPEIRIDDSSVIQLGRDTDNGIILEQDDVSRHHAEIRFKNGWVVVTDVGSSNGTKVNGTPLSKFQSQLIQEGTIQLGNFSLINVTRNGDKITIRGDGFNYTFSY